MIQMFKVHVPKNWIFYILLLKGALCFLHSEMLNFVNGQNIVVDDGYTIW